MKIIENIRNNITNSTKERFVIGIDGPSGSGKSYLSSLLNKYDDTLVIHVDDFFLTDELRNTNRLKEIGGNVDYDRLLLEVFFNLNKDKISYRKYDCKTNSFKKRNTVFLPRVIIIEGVYSLHKKFLKYYDLKVFLDVSESLQKERILKRSNQFMLNRYLKEWIPLENKYFSFWGIRKKCDIYSCLDE